MPITKNAKKALKGSLTKRTFNLRRTRTMREQVKAVREFVKAGKHKEASEALPATYKAIDKAAKRGIIKKNTASRKKSRLSKLIKKASVS